MLRWLENLEDRLFTQSRYMGPPWGPVLRVARYPAAFFVLHRHEATRETPQFRRPEIYHTFQFDRVIADRLFEQLAVVDIRTRPIPLDNLSFWISKWHSSSAEPAVLPIDSEIGRAHV